MGVRFEKWQALGNDYLVVEAPAQVDVRAVCDRHTGVGADGVLVLGPPDAPGFVARLRIFNPDGSEAELSGNGARQALMYLHARGRTASPRFSIQTAAGEVRAEVLDERTCRMDLGRARHRGRAADLPGGFAGELLDVGNPQCAIRVTSRDELEALDLAAVGPPIERDPRFPNRTNVSFWTETGAAAIRARIFERGVGETRSSGTGATGAAIGHVLRGGDSPVTVQLDGGELVVDVDEALHVELTGWAVPVFSGELL